MIQIPYQTGYSIYDITINPLGAHSSFVFTAGASGLDNPAFAFSGVEGKLYDDLGVFFGSYSNAPVQIKTKYIGQNGSPSATITFYNGQIFTNRQRAGFSDVTRARSETMVTYYDFSASDGSTAEVKIWGKDKDFSGGEIYYVTHGSANDGLIADFLTDNFRAANLSLVTGTGMLGTGITGESPLCVVLGSDVVASDYLDSFSYSNVASPILVMQPEVAGQEGMGLITGTTLFEAVNIQYSALTGVTSFWDIKTPRRANLVFKKRYPILHFEKNRTFSDAAQDNITAYDLLRTPISVGTTGFEYGRHELRYMDAGEVSNTSLTALFSFTGNEDCFSGPTAGKRVILNLPSTDLSVMSDDAKHIVLNSLAWLLDTSVEADFKDDVDPTGEIEDNDNLGNHIAEQDLDMVSYDILGADYVGGTGLFGNGNNIGTLLLAPTGNYFGFGGTARGVALAFDGIERTTSYDRDAVYSQFGHMKLSQISTSGSIGWVSRRNVTSGYMYSCGGYESASATTQSGQSYIEIVAPRLATGIESVSLLMEAGATGITGCYFDARMHSQGPSGIPSTVIYTATGQSVATANVPQIFEMVPTGTFDGDRLNIELTFYSKSSLSAKLINGQVKFLA